MPGAARAPTSSSGLHMVLVRERRRPPDPRPDVEHQRGHEHGAHDERVEQHAERDDEADLGQEHERQHGEHANVPASTMPAEVITAAGHRQAAQHALARAVAQRLLAHARHQEDVVVDPQRHEEDEREQRQRRVDAGEAEDESKTTSRPRARRRTTGSPWRSAAAARRSARSSTTRISSTTSSAIGTITQRVARRGLAQVVLDSPSAPPTSTSGAARRRARPGAAPA